MAEKKRQHFVPRLHLRRFSGSETQVDLLVMETGKVVRGASIGKQCYENYFYGKDLQIENAFEEQEGRLARLLKSIEGQRELPEPGTDDWRFLVKSVALQHTRTKAAARLTDAMTENLISQIVGDTPGDPGDLADRLRASGGDGVHIALTAAEGAALALEDLKGILMWTEDPSFITSDHPIGFYNTFAEKVTSSGVTGAACKGLQVLYPISPNCCIVLYDSETYALRPRHHLHEATGVDTRGINLVIASQADKAIYFGPWLSDDDASKIAQSVNKQREIPVSSLGVFDPLDPTPDANGNRSTILHTYSQLRAVKLALAPLSVQRKQRKIPPHERGSAVRRQSTAASSQGQPSPSARTFARRPPPT